MAILQLIVLLASAAQIQAPDESPRPGEATNLARQLLSIRRLYVDRLNGGETATQMRDLIISALQNSRLFTITENQERADAVLRGSAEDLVFTEVHSSSDSLNARGGMTTARSSRTSTTLPGLSVSGGENESMRSEERRHEAMATVRLVTSDGDVIWSTTQESQGAKFRGASADVADKITRKLAEDYQRARRADRRSEAPAK